MMQSAPQFPPQEIVEFERLVQFVSEQRCLVLTGAGCSTESGIPDYRGEGRPNPPRTPIQHSEFIERPDVRRRYWARATLGWPTFLKARPNRAHYALAAMEQAGALAGVVTQNVDRLHEAAGSRQVVELHGALADVYCLACGAHEPRAEVHERLLAQNPRWLERAALPAPDGDSELDVADVAEFEVVACRLCGGVLKPGVVFFGGNVASDVLARAWALFEETEALLVVGSSLTLFSGYRFVRRANETGRPVAIVNLGPTRADGPELGARLSARAGEVLPRLAEACGVTVTF